jgi:outer membrane assembly lipoprotein YfiO
MIKTRKKLTISLFLLASSLMSSDPHTFDVNLPQPVEKVSRKKRLRKSKEGKSKAKKVRTYLDMEYEQLVEAKERQKDSGNIPSTIKYLEQLLKITTDISLLAQHLLELADALYEDKQFKKSAFVYTQYCALYPGSDKQEYALYKSILSSFACILSADRDQTKTEETLVLTELFLKQDIFTSYKEEVTTIQNQCYQQLATNEYIVCQFYLTKGSLHSAEKRLAKMRSFWLPKLPTLEPDIITLEQQLDEKKTMFELTQQKNAQLAQNGKSKRMTNRF